MGAIPPDPPAHWREEVDAESAARALQILARSGIRMTEENARVETETITGNRLDAAQEDEAGIRYRDRWPFSITHSIWTLTQAFANIGAIFTRSGKQVTALQAVIRSLREQLDAHVAEDVEGDIQIADDRKDEVIQNLQEALYEYGDHKDGCAVEQQEPCDCGFDEILDLATQKKTSLTSSTRLRQSDFATLDQDAILRARERIMALTEERHDLLLQDRLDLQGIRPDRIETLRDSAGNPRVDARGNWIDAVNMPQRMVTSGERRLYGVSADGIWSAWEQLFYVCPQRSDFLDVSFEQTDPSLYRMFVAPDSRIDFELGIGEVGSEQCQMVAVVPHGLEGFGGNMIIPSFDVFGGERLVIRLRSNLVRAMAFHVCCNFFSRSEYAGFSTANVGW